MATHLPLFMCPLILNLRINQSIFQSCAQASSEVHALALARHCASQKSGCSVFSELLLLIHVSHTKADIKHWSVMCLSATFQRAQLLGLDRGWIAVTGSKLKAVNLLPPPLTILRCPYWSKHPARRPRAWTRFLSAPESFQRLQIVSLWSVNPWLKATANTRSERVTHVSRSAAKNLGLFTAHKEPKEKQSACWDRLIISAGRVVGRRGGVWSFPSCSNSPVQHCFDVSGSRRYEAENKYVYPRHCWQPPRHVWLSIYMNTGWGFICILSVQTHVPPLNIQPSLGLLAPRCLPECSGQSVMSQLLWGFFFP